MQRGGKIEGRGIVLDRWLDEGDHSSISRWTRGWHDDGDSHIENSDALEGGWPAYGRRQHGRE